MPLKIDCYMSLSCSSEEALRSNIQRALEELGIEAVVSYSRLTDEEAKRLNLRGSPSVLINGRDIQPASVSGFS